MKHAARQTNLGKLKAMDARSRRFALFAWGVLAWNVLVVLWGGFVRSTGSGAGCGNNWPLCNGAVVPRDPATATLIEFIHRATSGLALLAVAVLLVWALRLFPRAHPARRTALLSSAFILVEALLGAGLVLFGLVGDNSSPWRAVYLSAHLANTMLLLGSLTATAWYAAAPVVKRLPVGPAIRAALPVALVLSVTGAIAALGDTLYPAGVAAPEGPTPMLLQLRLLHPLTAVLAGAWLLYAALGAVRTPRLARAGWAVAALLGIQMAAGLVNVALQAPVWMQIFHLFLADLLWIALVVLYLQAAHQFSARAAS